VVWPDEESLAYAQVDRAGSDNLADERLEVKRGDLM
jgi:hypothetical protein